MHRACIAAGCGLPRVGQQHAVFHARHLPVRQFQPVAADAQEVLDALLVLAQALLRQV